MLYGWKENSVLTNCLAECNSFPMTPLKQQISLLPFSLNAPSHFSLVVCVMRLPRSLRNSFPTHVPLPYSLEPKVQKIAFFTYRSPHFCFPWRRRCDYHAICCTDGKQIRCLPNGWQHVRITRTLSKMASIVSELYVMRKSKNRYFTTFWFPLVQSG